MSSACIDVVFATLNVIWLKESLEPDFVDQIDLDVLRVFIQ